MQATLRTLLPVASVSFILGGVGAVVLFHKQATAAIPRTEIREQTGDSYARPGKEASVDPGGTVYMSRVSVPLSSFMSPEAKAGTIRLFQYMQTPAGKILALSSEGTTIEEQRRVFTEHHTPALERTQALYPVEQSSTNIAGVRADIFSPKDGIAPKNTNRVLINLHGGGFTLGAGIMAAMESMPVASLGKIKVISIDYRQGPEYKFPAATQDVVAVYKELLNSYEPRNIGIYGCSAGGLLTAETVAWIEKAGLPSPGAVGIFCASAGGWSEGDSGYLALPLMGVTAKSGQPDNLRHPSVSDVAYFSDADFNDPLVAPIRQASVLARFPPTLVLTSTRDIAASSAVNTHTQLVRLGVDAELHVWEGLPHGWFTLEPDFPESKDAWEVTVRFFDKHLGSN